MHRLWTKGLNEITCIVLGLNNRRGHFLKFFCVIPMILQRKKCISRCNCKFMSAATRMLRAVLGSDNQKCIV
jgi:hypothetical protein